MCEYCEKYHSGKGTTIGESMKIRKCANDTELKDCEVYINKDYNPAIIILDNDGMAKGYFEIKCCPICGRKLM